MEDCLKEKFMLKKTLLALAAFAVAGALALGAGFMLESDSAVKPIEAGSPCPVVGCASGECHGFGDVPEPDGVTEMSCPEATCADVECHAWDTLQGRYKQASDASLNIWILAPVVLVVGLVLLVGALSRPKKDDTVLSEADAKGDGE